MAVKPIPEGYATITPYLNVKDANRFIDFLKKVFNAQEIMRMPKPNGDIMHAEVRIGDSVLMLTDACEDWGEARGSIYLYLEDAEEAYQRAIDAGSESIMEMSDQFYGDRMGGVKDPFGNTWYVAKHVEDVAPDEIKKRVEAMMSQKGQA